MHEDVFWFDSDGELNVQGYGPDGVFNSFDEGYSVTDYKFSSPIRNFSGTVDVGGILNSMQGRTKVSGLDSNGMPTYQTTPWTADQYNLTLHNCQGYVTSARTLIHGM